MASKRPSHLSFGYILLGPLYQRIKEANPHTTMNQFLKQLNIEKMPPDDRSEQWRKWAEKDFDTFKQRFHLNGGSDIQLIFYHYWQSKAWLQNGGIFYHNHVDRLVQLMNQQKKPKSATKVELPS